MKEAPIVGAVQVPYPGPGPAFTLHKVVSVNLLPVNKYGPDLGETPTSCCSECLIAGFPLLYTFVCLYITDSSVLSENMVAFYITCSRWQVSTHFRKGGRPEEPVSKIMSELGSSAPLSVPFSPDLAFQHPLSRVPPTLSSSQLRKACSQERAKFKA